MKKSILALILISFLVFPIVGLAALPDCRALVGRAACERAVGCWWHVRLPERETENCLPYKPMPRVGLIGGITTVVNIIFTILVAAAVIFVMIGAFQLLSAGGDTEKIGEGRQKILYAVIAVVVALLARGIIDFIRDAF